MSWSWSTFSSPVGELFLVAEDDALVQVWFEGSSDRPGPHSGWTRGGRTLDEARRQLEEYFAGRRRSFDLALAPRGTPFQARVWSQLRRIPFGETLSYGELAGRVGNPRASRAVGTANGRNPIPIVIPCHRVIGRDGSLTGFGGGIDRKRLLLELERSVAKPEGPSARGRW